METELKSGRVCVLGAWNFIKGDPRMFVVVRPSENENSVLVKIHAKFKPLVEFNYPLQNVQHSDISVILDDELCKEIAAHQPQ